MLKIATIVISTIIIAFILLNLFSIVKTDINKPVVEDETPEPEVENALDVEELLIETLEEGEGVEAKDGDTVLVHYTGQLLDGTVFDSSVEKGEPFSFTLGEGRVIQGWDEGVKGMKVGEKRFLVIPSTMGYGELGSPPTIPASAGLQFEVELLEIVQ
jgi:FKBP-type peptidyl-prolyl cis-trans isomerase